MPDSIKTKIQGEIESATLCDSCALADVSCPVYPQVTQTCVVYRPKLGEIIVDCQCPAKDEPCRDCDRCMMKEMR